MTNMNEPLRPTNDKVDNCGYPTGYNIMHGLYIEDDEWEEYSRVWLRGITTHSHPLCIKPISRRAYRINFRRPKPRSSSMRSMTYYSKQYKRSLCQDRSIRWMKDIYLYRRWLWEECFENRAHSHHTWSNLNPRGPLLREPMGNCEYEHAESTEQCGPREGINVNARGMLGPGEGFQPSLLAEHPPKGTGPIGRKGRLRDRSAMVEKGVKGVTVHFGQTWCQDASIGTIRLARLLLSSSWFGQAILLTRLISGDYEIDNDKPRPRWIIHQYWAD